MDHTAIQGDSILHFTFLILHFSGIISMKGHPPSHLFHGMAFPETFLLQVVVNDRCIVEQVACQVRQVFQDPFTDDRLGLPAIIAGSNRNLCGNRVLFEVDMYVIVAVGMYVTNG